MDAPLEENNSPFIIWQGSHEMPADFGRAPSKKGGDKTSINLLVYREPRAENRQQCTLSVFMTILNSWFCKITIFSHCLKLNVSNSPQF